MICLLVERAVQRWLLGAAAWLVTGDGEYVVTEKGLRIRLVSGYEYFLPVLCGQDDVEVIAPAVIAACASATQSFPGTMTHRVNLEIGLRFPAAESQEHRFMLDAFHHAVGKLQDALYRSDLETALSGVQDGFTCLHKTGLWQQASGWMDGNRTYLFSRTLDVAPTDFSGGGD